MNVAIIGKFYTEGFGLHIEEALHQMGHSVVRVDPEVEFLQYDFLGKRVKNINKTLYQEVLYKIPFIRKFKSKEIYKYFQQEKVDLTLSLHDFLTKDEVSKIKELTHSPVVLWFPDAMSNFQKSMFFIAGYDHLFFSDKYIVKKLREEFKLNVSYLPQCFSQYRHKKVKLSAEEEKYYGCEITNAGNLYPSRAALYKHLLKYNIKMWGAPPAVWLKDDELEPIVMHKKVFNEEKSKAFTAAKIVLNNLHPAVVDGVNKRTFEIPACGAFQISSYREATSELFKIDKEIVCYKDLNDLKEKIDYYLDPSNEAERKEIANAGFERAMKDHSYDNRMVEMFDLIAI